MANVSLKDVCLAIDKRNKEFYNSLDQEQQKKFNKSFVGSNMEILFEKKGRYKDQYIGRSIYNQSVFATSETNLINKITNAKITNSCEFALESGV